MAGIEKLIKLKSLMGYFELVSFTNKNLWGLRNVTDEGLAQDTPFSTVKFSDTNLEELIDRAISYAENGPSKDIVKAALEVTALFGKKTIIQGDTITIMYDYINDISGTELIEEKLVEMGYRYDKYELDTVYINENGTE